MAFTNLTGDPKPACEELACSTEFTRGVHTHLIALLALNGFVAITAFLGNTLILVALHKESSLHSPSKLLFCNLATTDLCVGIIAKPLYITYLISALEQRWNICRYAFVIFHTTSHILCGVSLFTLTAISVDRLLALLLGLRYRQVVTLKGIYRIVVVFWVVSTAGATLLFWSERIIAWYDWIKISLCVVTAIFSDAKIFVTLCHNRVEAHQGKKVQFNTVRYRKAVSSVVSVKLGLFVLLSTICYRGSFVPSERSDIRHFRRLVLFSNFNSP